MVWWRQSQCNRPWAPGKGAIACSATNLTRGRLLLSTGKCSGLDQTRRFGIWLPIFSALHAHCGLGLLQEALDNHGITELASVLNPILGTEFPDDGRVAALKDTQRNAITISTLLNWLFYMAALRGPLTLILEHLHHCRCTLSLEFLQQVLCSQ